MRTGEPSRTALATAHARAYHQVAPDEPRIFTDPLALRILGLDVTESADRDTATLETVADADFQRKRRWFLAARSRFAEETVAAAYAAGARQVVILGAGLDTFGYRNPHAGLRVFEVDHPDTQGWKRERLAETGIAVPGTLTFVPVDFESRTLADGLAAAGFARSEPAVFVWLGVIMYLTRESLESTLGYLAGQDAPVQVVIDYLCPARTAAEQAALAARAARIAAVGEPWLTSLSPTEMAELLSRFGFTGTEDLSAPELITRYTGETGGAARKLATSHIVRAIRGGAPL
ncbi:class I SAM-dependent methyltransferase [Nocardia inohanensis]|uniref:class I SAM-dependent methyltransferase n=1 Tax=Nocardia inohanensis TaxID=209246 RepID=UPI0008351B37|nr:class I SAM-dependent methyltransferase [Nocardia inohanensis]